MESCWKFLFFPVPWMLFHFLRNVHLHRTVTSHSMQCGSVSKHALPAFKFCPGHSSGEIISLNTVHASTTPQEKSLRRIFQLRQQKVDIATALLAWKGKYIASIKEVLMTESTPRICWLPSAHNERTKKMLENRNEEVNY